MLRILTAITDDNLRQEFLRTEVDERTHTLLKDLGQRLETARATKKCLTAQSKGPNASQEDPPEDPRIFIGQSGHRRTTKEQEQELREDRSAAEDRRPAATTAASLYSRALLQVRFSH